MSTVEKLTQFCFCCCIEPFLQSFSEIDDDDAASREFFKKFDTNKDEKLSVEEVESAIHNAQAKSWLQVDGLKNLRDLIAAKAANEEVNLEAFNKIVSDIPRLHGQRIQWARSLNLDGLLACRLKAGFLFDELSGIRETTEAELDKQLLSFFLAVSHAVKREWKKLQDPCSSPSAEVETVMNKFTGIVGKFRDAVMFQEGLVNQIGSPDPYILKGILHDNVLAEGSKKRSVTSNYKLLFDDSQEYARILGNPQEYTKDSHTKLQDSDLRNNRDIPIFLKEVAKGLHPETKGPSETELKDLEPEFKKLRERFETTLKENDGCFPGDIGHVQKSMEIEFEASNLDTAKRIHEALVTKSKTMTNNVSFEIGSMPSGNSVTVSVFAPLSFFSSKADKDLAAWFQTLGFLKKHTNRCYIYCDLSHKQSDGHAPASLQDQLKSSDLPVLRQISGLQHGTKEDCIDKILKEPNQPQISLMQGRRALSLRQLMELPDVKNAELRVEEAIQAHQYTGPMFQVNITSYSLNL